MKKELEAFRGGRELELVRSGRGHMKERVLDEHQDGIWVGFISSWRPTQNL